jgi:hypothetical protein
VADSSLELLFAEICAGNSRAEIVIPNSDNPLVFYYRHAKHTELFELERFTQAAMYEAREAGLFTFDEALAHVISEGWWTQEQEAELNQNNAMLKRLMETRTLMGTKRERDELDKQILPTQETIARLLNERTLYIPQTAEAYANKKINHLHITKFLYKDADCSTLLFDEEEFFNLSPATSYLLQSTYLNLIDQFSNDNIQKLASSVMFQNFLYVGGDTTNDFFGVPVTKVTRYQFELFIGGQNFKNIIKNCATMEREIPESIYGDPKAMNAHYDMVKNAWEQKNGGVQRNAGGDSGSMGVSRVGATKEESKIMYGADANNGGLLAAARKNGGKLDMRSAMQKRGV